MTFIGANLTDCERALISIIRPFKVTCEHKKCFDLGSMHC